MTNITNSNSTGRINDFFDLEGYMHEIFRVFKSLSGFLVLKLGSKSYAHPPQEVFTSATLLLTWVESQNIYNRMFFKIIMLLHWHSKPNKVPYAHHYKLRLVHFYPIFEDHFFVFFNVENWSMEFSVISNLWVESSTLENLLPLLHTRSWSMKSWLNQE